MFFVHRHAISHGPTRQIIVEPVHVISIVGDPVLNAKSLGDETTAPLVKAEGNRIGDERLRGEQLDFAAGRKANARHRLPGLVRSGGDFRLETAYGLLAASKSGYAGREKDAPKDTNCQLAINHKMTGD
jgi:hypothetical protein